MREPVRRLRAMTKMVLTAITATCLSSTAAHAFDGWDWTVEGGYLWGMRLNTKNDYEMAPVLLTLRSPATLEFGDWVVRSRFSALAASFTRGPEDYYTGLLAAPSIERNIDAIDTTLLFSIGGGIGLTNSSGGNNGLGHDFTLNWFAQGGIHQRLTETIDWQASVFFLHLSNGARTDPNPAVDALGFTLGVTRRF